MYYILFIYYIILIYEKIKKKYCMCKYINICMCVCVLLKYNKFIFYILPNFAPCIKIVKQNCFNLFS